MGARAERKHGNQSRETIPLPILGKHSFPVERTEGLPCRHQIAHSDREPTGTTFYDDEKVEASNTLAQHLNEPKMASFGEIKSR